MNARLNVTLAVLCLLAVFQAPAQQVVTTATVNLRRSASSKSSVLERFNAGDTLTLLSAARKNRYYHVTAADGKQGWVLASGVRRVAQTSSGQSTAGAADTAGWSDSLAHWAKPQPVELDTGKCVPVGAGIAHVDSATDLRKNRIDKVAAYHSVPFKAILGLPWQGLPTKRFGWSANDNAKVAIYEGVPVAAEGYLGGAKEEGKEATNCELDTPAWHDWHVWLVQTQSQGTSGDRRSAIVVEVTPRVRASHPAWSLDSLVSFHSRGQLVRISGWLMLDPDHPDQVGKTRGTTWEIHPVLKIEVSRNGAWQDLDAQQ